MQLNINQEDRAVFLMLARSQLTLRRAFPLR